MKIKSIKNNKIIKNAYRTFRKSITRISAVLATKIMYRIAFNKKINLIDPKTFNEKLQWLKLYWRDELKSYCTDKFEVTNYAKEMGCSEITNEIYEVYSSVDEINWDKLPNKFALKCTHGCGANIICYDKSKLDINESIKKLNKWMKEDYGLEYAEIHYSDIKPRIICEKYLETDSGILPIDYKIFCFNGIPKITMLCRDRKVGRAKYYFYDNDWNIKPYNEDGLLAIKNKEKKIINSMPKSFSKMLKYAELLSKPFPFVRIDFYEVKGKPILGEMTFTHSGCLEKEITTQADEEMGSWINIKNL